MIKALNIGGTQILVGDFNLHHPIWGGRASKRHLLADKLIEATEEAGLISLLSTGSVTRELVVNEGTSRERTQRTTVDLVFGSQTIARRLIGCEVRRDLGTGSDHLPIETHFAFGRVIGIGTTAADKRAWKKTDIPTFLNLLETATESHFQRPLDTIEQIEEYVKDLVKAVRDASFKTTPKVKESLYDKGLSYLDPAAYRPIALLNTLGKVLEVIVARRISNLAERYNLLLDKQYGARSGRLTEDALLNL